MPRLKGSADLLEDRRKRALALLDSGYSLNEVGRLIGCAAVCWMRWRDARRRGGEHALEVLDSLCRPLNIDACLRKCSDRLPLTLHTPHRSTTHPTQYT